MGLSYNTTAIATGANATQAIVAAVAGKIVRVHGYSISNAGTTGGTGQWQDSAAVALSGAMTMTTHQPFTIDNSNVPIFSTATGTGLSLTTAGGGNCNGWVTWSYS
jgi:hypothetical protein